MNVSNALPGWSEFGVLPPINPEVPGTSSERSPYRVSLEDFVIRFGTSEKRREILSGLLRFREEMHKRGIVSGFQWLNGSFLEHIELSEDRDPRDIDVVTFFDMPKNENQDSFFNKNKELFDHDRIKNKYFVDSYFFVLGEPVDAFKVQNISYWYSMWSHRRDGLWKGFVQVDLNSSHDADVQVALTMCGGFQHE
ncbi:MAG: hypothetical protein PHU72_10320 [Dethiosulfovibrio sp.]|nr:hypothetical protein [Dethiosulfovibrio sp.]